MQVPQRCHAGPPACCTVRLAVGVMVTLLSLAEPGPAQSKANTTTRLGDVYAQVQSGNPRVTAANALVRAARARIPGVTRPPDPQLQLGLMNYTVPGLKPMEPLGMTQLQLMQMVPIGGKLALAGRIAGAQASATEQRALDLGWELRSRTAMAFYDLYATDRQLDIARETLRLLQDIARTAVAMYRVGDGRQSDVLRADVEVARMTEDTVRMLAMRETMVARLNALRDQDPGVDVATPVLPRFPDSIPRRAWLDSLARDGRPMTRAGLADLRAAEASAALARREIIPDLQVGIQYGQRRATMTVTDPVGVTMTERITERMGSLMVGASIPIFARDRQYQMRTEADAMQAMAEADVASMRAETRARIGEAYASLSRARALARLYESTVLPQAEATVRASMSAYRSGSVDFMTLLDNRMAVNRYRQELHTLEADEGKAWAELEMLIGRELFDPRITAASVGDPAVAPTMANRGAR